MEPTNTGSFGAAIGGVDALKAAMQRRGMDASVLDQVSGTAPTGPSEVSPGLAAPGGAGLQIPRTASPGTEEVPVSPVRSGEMEIAMKAMNSVINTENKIAEMAVGLR